MPTEPQGVSELLASARYGLELALDDGDIAVALTPPEIHAVLRALEDAARLEKLYQAALDAVSYVGQCNYASREREAQQWIYEARYGNAARAASEAS